MAALITPEDTTIISSRDDWNSPLPDFPVFTLDPAVPKGSQQEPGELFLQKKSHLVTAQLKL